MTPESPPPYVRSRTTSRGVRFELVEPTIGATGRAVTLTHALGSRRDPREALEHFRVLLADRIAWSAGSTDPVELAQVEATRARVEALAVAVAKNEKARERRDED
jgi:hypothetical protein